MLMNVVLDGGPLTIDGVARVARFGALVEIAPAARAALQQSRDIVERTVGQDEPHYGINTGFGSLSRRRIPADRLQDLQRNLVRSHAAGAGDPLPDAIVRATMLALAASLCRGYSGVRVAVVDQIVALLNGGVTPVVPSIGSVGASGDLAPLAHIALVLIGEGSARVSGPPLGVEPEPRTAPTSDPASGTGSSGGGAARADAPGERRPDVRDGAAALAAIGREPLVLEPKEGLALINGTHLMAAEGALLCEQFGVAYSAALLACAMSIDAARATDAFLDDRAYAIRQQPGPRAAAAALRAHLAGSAIVPSHRANDPRVQDPYSFRCAAYVMGAAADAAAYVSRAVEAELAAVTDNPLVFREGDVVSAGNFHGMPVALPLDVLAIASAHLAGIAQQRIYYMLSARDPETELVPYLSAQPGLCSGLMVTQYTAAACCNELAGLAAPASVVNLPTSAGMEDYNSFGPRSAAKARRALELTRQVIAIELLCAAQGLEYHRPLRSGEAVERVYAQIRTVVPPLTADRPPAPDIRAIARLVEDSTLL
jgi:histidine ammonia-lyase